MVTVQDIGLQLTKPVKELASWNFPFAQTLEQYCSLFNTTCNRNFGEAGLVLQNSTAVYVHRIDSLWTKVVYCKNVLSTNEQEEATKNSKKRDRKTAACFHNFKTVNFEKEVDKNIDIKKNHIAHDSVKSKSRRFTQLEKGIAQHVSIAICDVNGEVIGKKYDFRCNQNISMDGTLVDEFAPQDFCCGNDISANEKASSNYYRHSDDTSTPDSILQDNENFDAESERNVSLQEEISDLTMSLVSSQQNLSLSRNFQTDNSPVKTPTNISSDSYRDATLVNTPNQICPDTPSDTNSPIITNLDNTILSNNNNLEDQCLNNINEGIDAGSLLDSPPESVNSKGRRTSSTDDLAVLNDTNGDLTQAKSCISSIQNTPLNESKRTRQRSTLKSTPKLLKRKLFASSKKRQNITKKNLLHILEDPLYPQRDRSSMFNKSLRSCIKFLREYDPLQYKEVMNEESDLLGFQSHINTEPNAHINDNVNVNNNVTISTDKEVSERHNLNPMSMSRENFCDVWFRSDSSHSLSETVDKWHEMMQPKLRDAEQRSTFYISDYTSRIMESLKTSSQRKINFDTVIQKEHPCEVARYFLATLDLAAKQNVNINTNADSENNIEIALQEEDEQCSINTNSQADSHD